MPRGSRSSGGRSSMGSRPASTAASAPRPASNVPAAPPPAPAAAPPQVIVAQRQPGLLANVATTAAGVAIGHTMGTAITGALGLGGGHQPAEQPQQQAVAQPQFAGQQQGSAPCAFELDQFIRCTQQNDLQLCHGFNEALKECRARFGAPSQGF